MADAVEWRRVKLGVSSLNRVQITDEVTEGDSVALPIDTALHDGQRVSPVYP